jgi:D-tyrosyl-tRNA(Tyr) deacylase
LRVLIQRVKRATVDVEGDTTAGIENGLLLFAGIGKEDNEKDLEYLSRKVANLRIFEDEQGRMNLNILQAGGQILSVSQFTLYADTRKGNRPGFDRSAAPDTARKLWENFNQLLREQGIDVQQGEFGAHMHVGLVNDGPVTIWLDSKQR